MHKNSVFSYSIADTLFTTCNFYRCHTVPFTHTPQHLYHAISHVSHPGWSKNGKALIKSFQKETRSTRAQGDNPFYIPEGLILDEYYDLAMESGMDPQECILPETSWSKSLDAKFHFVIRLISSETPRRIRLLSG